MAKMPASSPPPSASSGGMSDYPLRETGNPDMALFKCDRSKWEQVAGSVMDAMRLHLGFGQAAWATGGLAGSALFSWWAQSDTTDDRIKAAALLCSGLCIAFTIAAIRVRPARNAELSRVYSLMCEMDADLPERRSRDALVPFLERVWRERVTGNDHTATLPD